MICSGANHANVDAIPLIPTGKAIYDVNAIPGVQVVDGSFSIDFPDLNASPSASEDQHAMNRRIGGLRRLRVRVRTDKR